MIPSVSLFLFRYNTNNKYSIVVGSASGEASLSGVVVVGNGGSPAMLLTSAVCVVFL